MLFQRSSFFRKIPKRLFMMSQEREMPILSPILVRPSLSHKKQPKHKDSQDRLLTCILPVIYTPFTPGDLHHIIPLQRAADLIRSCDLKNGGLEMKRKAKQFVRRRKSGWIQLRVGRIGIDSCTHQWRTSRRRTEVNSNGRHARIQIFICRSKSLDLWKKMVWWWSEDFDVMKIDSLQHEVQ
jgi:hypothetical protein